MKRALFRVVALSLCLAAGLSAQINPARNAPSARPAPAGTQSVSPDDLMHALDRVLLILERGKKEDWASRDQFLAAVQQSAGKQPSQAGSYIACTLQSTLREHTPWDEGPPLAFEVDQTIRKFQQLRTEAQRAQQDNPSQPLAQLPLCSPNPPKKVTLSQGMAASRLQTRVEPVFLTGDWKLVKPEKVLLSAIIDKHGRIDTLKIISGPLFLLQASLDAVRQWRYRPYTLNGVPVPFQTTVELEYSPPKP